MRLIKCNCTKICCIKIYLIVAIVTEWVGVHAGTLNQANTDLNWKIVTFLNC